MNSIFEDQKLTLADGVRRLEEAGINYMLTGSVAMIRFAMARMTNDIDIVIELSHKDKDRFIRAFSDDYYVPEEKIPGAIDRRSMFNVLSNQTLIKIDLAMKKDTPFHQQAFDDRERTHIWGVDLWSIKKDDLIVSKLYWAKDSRSELQQRDVVGIMLNGFDLEYVTKWTKQLGVGDLLADCIIAMESGNA